MPAGDFLLIDIGNTTAKLRLARADRLLGATRRLPTALLAGRRWQGRAALREILRGWSYGQAVLSSVAPAAGQTAALVLAAARVSVFAVDAAADLGVSLARYPQRRTLGSDRLANIAGAWARHGGAGHALIVVDFGTAATFNAVDAGGFFLGGVIAPGLAAARDYLPGRAALLPAVGRLRVPATAVGRSTRQAMLAGTVLGYRGLAREILTSLREELAGGRGGAVRVIATGGDARLVARWLPGWFAAVEPELTLQGLRIIGARQAAAGQPPGG